MPTAAPEAMQEVVAQFVEFLSDPDAVDLPGGVEIEQTPLTTFQICEDGENGYRVMTCGPLKFNGDRCIAIIEGLSHRDHYIHFVDAMDGTPKMDAARLPYDIWGWSTTVRQVQDIEGAD